MRRRLNSRFSALTTKTVSRFVATICSLISRPATLRVSLVLRGSTCSIRARPSSGRGDSDPVSHRRKVFPPDCLIQQLARSFCQVLCLRRPHPVEPLEFLDYSGRREPG